MHLADALGEADLAAAALREAMEGTKGFKEGHMDWGSYLSLWLAPIRAFAPIPNSRSC